MFSRNSTDIDDLLEKLGGTPVIIKLARGTHGNGVVLAESKKAAKSVLQAFYLTNEDGTNVLLQEFVKESAGTDIRAFVVGSRVVASMRHRADALLATVAELAGRDALPDVVITDVRMPPTMTNDGLRAAIRIKEDLTRSEERR